MTHQSAEANNRNQRVVDEQRRDLRAYADQNAKMISVARMQSNDDVKRHLAEQQACKAEQLYQDQIYNQKNNRIVHERKNYQDQAIASILSHDADIQLRRGLEIQRICDDSDELRELERNLKTAYLNKERAAQCKINVAKSAMEQRRIDEIQDHMEYDRQRAILDEEERNQSRREKLHEQRYILQDQMREKERRIEESKSQLIKERNMVDDIVNRINQEDEDEYRRRKESQAAQSRMIREAEEQRSRQIAAAKLAAKEEEERIAAYNRSLTSRNDGVAAKRQAKLDYDARILHKMSEEAAARQREDQEYEDLRNMLYEEEIEEKKRNEYRERRERQINMKRDIIEGNYHLMASKAEMRRAEMENEVRMVELMRKKFAEDEAREKEEEEIRIRKKQEQLSYLEKQQSERRYLDEEERARELDVLMEENRREEYKKKVVQEARKRLLDEHAARLQGFLPGKLFNDTDEHDRYQYQDQRQDQYQNQNRQSTSRPSTEGRYR
jgi:Trichohyalin-plectin-homology domain